MGNITPELARLGAKWWTDQLAMPIRWADSRFNQVVNTIFDRAKLSISSELNEENIRVFEDELARQLEKCDLASSLSVDYQPQDNPIFAQAAVAAGIRLRFPMLPIKTKMYFEENSIRIREWGATEDLHVLSVKKD